MHATLPLLETRRFPPLRRAAITTLQVNLGYRCNQSCVHCHVNAGPGRSEMMDADTLDLIPQVLAARAIGTLDLTGGAPELHPGFRTLVRAARALGVRVIDRCNLTILSEPGHDDLAEFLAAQGVEIVASLPCYVADNVERQRGKGVFERSIAGLLRLNALGYGQPGSGLVLNLVYNPQGPVLPPDQARLEADYRHALGTRFGIVFSSLFALANMPIQRFGSMLISKGQFNAYMVLLQASHREENLDAVMCRALVSVDWRGRLYDCDFNQQLGLPLGAEGASDDLQPDAGAAPVARTGSLHVRDLLARSLEGAPIRVAGHCYGCTAGSGSSCGGALRG